jgi:uncharacterized damage-inducible protein DinB
MIDSRPHLDRASDERTTLTQYLDWFRATIEVKVTGLTEDQARERHVASDTTALGLIRHLTEAERYWFQEMFLGQDLPILYCTEEDPDGDFHPRAEDTVDEALENYRRECDRSREIVTATKDFGQLAARRSRTGEPINLRWIMVHMIEETSRHAGHLDIIRERTDGVVGE